MHKFDSSKPRSLAILALSIATVGAWPTIASAQTPHAGPPSALTLRWPSIGSPAASADTFALVPQTAPRVLVPPDVPLRVIFHSPDPLTQVSFRVLNGDVIHHNFVASALSQVDAPLAECGIAQGPATCFEYTGDMPGLARGTHQIRVRAFNDFGEETSGPLEVVAGTPPGPISVPRVIRIEIALNEDGTINWGNVRVTAEGR